jgi:tRNA A-37 threonylcarbamoyl transferase component Bud32
MNAQSCPPRSALSSWLSGRNSRDDESIAAHLDACPACRAAAAEIESAEPLLRGLKGLGPHQPVGAAELPEALAARLRQLPLGEETVIVPPEATPKRLRDYELLEPIGAGGMGCVYKARHRRLGRLFAVKLLPTKAKDRVERFRRELAALGPLDHPNVVRATDAGEAGGVMYLAMEYVEGTDAEKLAQRTGPLPVARACDIARQAALGLNHLHEAGLVHRDVKPANLMVTPDGTVRLLDLGLAASEHGNDDRLTRDGAVLGTPDYLAPEQARDPRSADRRADLYGLGCTLYHLLAGRPPFAGRGRVGTLLAHHDEEPARIEELRPDVPPPLAAVVRRLMAKDPSKRFATALDAASALAPYCEIPVARPRRRFGRAVLIAAAVPIALAVGWLAWDEIKARLPRGEQLAEADASVSETPASAEPRFEIATAKPLDAQPATLTATEDRSAPQAQGSSQVQESSQAASWLDAPAADVKPPVAAAPPPAGENVAVAAGSARRELVGPVAMLTGHTQPVIAIAFSPDGRRAVSAGGHQFEPVITWDLEKRRSAGELRPGATVDVAFLPKSPGRFATATRFDLELWDAGGNEPVARMGQGSVVACFAVAADAPFAATGTEGGRVAAWDLAGRRMVLELPLNQIITAVAISPDGKTIAAATNDANVHLWNVAADRVEQVITGHVGNVNALAFGTDGAKLWVGERFSAGGPADAHRVLVYDLKTFAADRMLPIAEPGRLVSRVAFQPASGLALAGHGDGTVTVWDVATGEKLLTDRKHAGNVTGLAISADGRAALSGGNDAKVWLWDLTEKRKD